jgi:protocatechuate 3,4-dioxygenase beta subunit
VPDTLIEIWQANAAGRYAHPVDQRAAPLDPNFSGAGRCLTDADGRYRFVTIRPGASKLRVEELACRFPTALSLADMSARHDYWRDRPGSAHSTLKISKWKVGGEAVADDFIFTPPADASKVDLEGLLMETKAE